MRRFGVYDVDNQKFKYTYWHNRSTPKNLAKYRGMPQVDITDSDPDAWSWDGAQMVKDSSYFNEQKFRDQKKYLQGQIDKNTGKLISQGFEFDGRQFSYSDKAQLNWVAMKSASDMIHYPKEISTIDDNEDDYELSFVSSRAFFAAAINVKDGHLATGRALKKSIRKAKTWGQLNAIVDNRLSGG